jgi:putative SOS response-associated peptidase YedK
MQNNNRGAFGLSRRVSFHELVGVEPAPSKRFPDYPALVIRNAGNAEEMMLMRMPPPPRTGGPPVTNIRNTSSPHWRGWLKPENRCLVARVIRTEGTVSSA